MPYRARRREPLAQWAGLPELPLAPRARLELALPALLLALPEPPRGPLPEVLLALPAPLPERLLALPAPLPEVLLALPEVLLAVPELPLALRARLPEPLQPPRAQRSTQSVVGRPKSLTRLPRARTA